MTAPGPGVTRFASLGRRRAVAVVAAFVVVIAWLVAGAARGPVGSGIDVAAQGGGTRENDVAFYKAVVARVRAGENYYDAVGPELRRRHFPLRPAFAWRQPTYAWLLARLPSPWVGNAMLAVIGAAVVALTARWVQTTAFARRTLIVVALMSVTMATCLVGDFVYMQESWAGALVALSVVLHATGRWRGAVAAGLAALAFREFAVLPCVLALGLAARARRWPEVRAWTAGLALWAALLAWHISRVAAHVLPTDLSRGWLALGGAPFVLEMCRWNGLFVIAPRIVLALALPFVLLGLAGWRDAAAARAALIVLGYLATFSVVGHTFNDYWGAMFAPLLTLGLVAAPAATRELARALVGRAPPEAV
ncbi:MAG TPA: hypothetical protein VHJ20_17185 [Polyangia bacterium]|nr:hypothetical protein [Polyangia bacterium]